MAVTVTQLSAALRLGDGVTAPVEPQLAILTRLLGLAQATVAVYASTGTPDAAMDQAIILFSSYLYDQPDAPRGQGYSVAFRNSGAAHVLEPWKVRGLGLLEEGTTPASVPVPVPSVGGLDRTQVQTLIDAAIRSHSVQASAHHAKTALPMPANNAEADAAISTTIRAWTGALIRRVVEAIVPSWARQDDPPGAGSVVRSYTALTTLRSMTDAGNFQRSDFTTAERDTIVAALTAETYRGFVAIIAGQVSERNSVQYVDIPLIKTAAGATGNPAGFEFDEAGQDWQFYFVFAFGDGIAANGVLYVDTRTGNNRAAQFEIILADAPVSGIKIRILGYN